MVVDAEPVLRSAGGATLLEELAGDEVREARVARNEPSPAVF
jgi:hypothetical protein